MTSKDPITYHTLGNGLRIVHLHCDSMVEYCGVAINAGSRDEQPNQYGLAHFVEHTIFKGTSRRRSWHIINRMEAVGGELNAFTSKEETVLYSIFPYGNLSRAVDLIADLITSSQFPAAQLDKEREVVAEEINSYLDSPAEAVYDDFEDLLFKGSQLGHNILGTADAISLFDSEICKSYIANFYTAPNMIFFYMGRSPASRLIKTVERYLNTLSDRQPSAKRVSPNMSTTFNECRDIGSHQAHTIMGAPLPGLYSSQRYAIALLANIIGGPGMNSMLNVALRERRGLVYTVEASTVAFTDAGAMTIYFGCDPADAKRCRHIVSDTIINLADKRLSEKALEAAKKQYLGQLAVASDNREQAAIAAARAMLYHGTILQEEQIVKNIRDITTENLRQIAASVAANLSYLTLT